MRKNKLCCHRFAESVAELKIIPSKGLDETDWYFPEGLHLYFCPFCGKHVKGKGYGNFDADENQKAVEGGSIRGGIDKNLMKFLDFPEGSRFPTDLIDIQEISIRVSRKIQSLSNARVSRKKFLEGLDVITGDLLEHLPYHQRGLKSLRKKMGDGARKPES